jgi:pimeloyl-ACP methyl ester carboxylesterase
MRMRDVTRIGFRAAGLTAAIVGAQEWMARRYYATTGGPERLVDEAEATAWTPIWHELLAPIELARLRVSPVYRGHGVPHGAGDPVLLIHGFLMRGGYLRPLEAWLQRIGYRARIARIGLNADCVDVMSERLLTIVAQVSEGAGARVHLVGHSLGGLLARVAASRAPERVASVASLGSPFRGLRVHPAVRAAAAVVRAATRVRRGAAVRAGCLTLACECGAVRALRHAPPADMPQLAVITRYDGIADWRYCMDPSMPVVEVPSSHIGLVASPAAYRALAGHLSRACTRAGAPIAPSRG